MAQSEKKPNVVVILADDLGYGDLSCYGGPTRTPHLDKMAAEGVRFSDFYTPMPYCAPTRASLLTGRYPFRNGMTNNPAPDGGQNFGLNHEEVTLADVMKKQGYATMCIGKWHLGHTAEYLPTKRGFDEYLGILYSNDMRPVQLIENERVVEYPVVQATLTKRYTERALAFIEKNKDRPFFLYLPHAMPHKPLAASEDFYTPDTPADLYADVIRELDWSVGQILAKLKAEGLDENTFVLFTSDNGPWYGGNTSGLRGMKARPFDGGIRVPAIARWPGRIPVGVTTKEIAGIIDIFPTVCSIAKAPLPDRKLDGMDLLPLLTGKTKQSPHEALFAMNGARLAIVRSGKWKLHAISPGPDNVPDSATWVDPRGPDGVTLLAPAEQARPAQYPGLLTGDAPKQWMLFDMEADRAEQHDVSAQHPDVVARLRGLYEKMNAEVPPPKPAAPGSRRLLRLKGGSFDYGTEAKPPVN